MDTSENSISDRFNGQGRDPKFIAEWMRCKVLGCDGVIKTEDGGVFPVHFIVLCPASGFFRVWYLNQLHNADGNPPEMLIRNVSRDTMEKVLQFIYSDCVNCYDEKLTELLFAADYLLVDSLVARCSDIMLQSLTDDNCVLFFKTALILEHLALVPMTRRYLLLHFEDVIYRDMNSIVDFPHEILLHLLEEDSLNASEETVWNVIHHWLSHDVVQRLKYLPSLLRCLRFSLLSHEFISNNIACDPNVQSAFAHSASACDFLKRHCNSAAGRSETPTELLQEWLDEPLSFGPRAPKEVVFLIRDREMCSRDNRGCWIYEMYDYQFDTYRLVTAESSRYLPSLTSAMCVVGRKICVQSLREGDGVAVFDLISRTWDWLPPFHSVGFEPHIVSLKNKLYALGGYDNEAEQALEVYDEDEEDWIPLEPMTLRHDGMAVADRDYIYVSDGYVSEGEPDEYLGEIEKYDPETDTWSFIARTNILRNEFSMVVYRNELYAIGGTIRGAGPVRVVEKYDSEKDTWQRLQDLPYAAYGSTLLVIDDVLIYSTYFPHKWFDVEKHALFLDVSTGSWKPVTELDRPWVNMLQKCVSFQAHQVCVVRDPIVIGELRKEKWYVQPGSCVMRDALDNVTSGAYYMDSSSIV